MLLTFAKKFVPNKPILENKIVFSFIVASFIKSVTEVLDVDYYSITRSFKDLLSQKISQLKKINTQRLNREEKQKLSKSLNRLIDLEKNARIIKEEGGVDIIHSFNTILTEEGKISGTRRAIFPKNNVSYQIFVFLPFEYKGNKKNFIKIFSDFGKKFRHKKVGDIIKIGKTAYKILAIT